MPPTPNATNDSLNPYESSAVRSDKDAPRTNSRFGGLFYPPMVLSGGVLLGMLATQRRFEAIFVEFGLELPQATLFALSPWAVALAGALFLFTLAKEFTGAHPTFLRICNGVAFLAAIVLGLAYAAATLLPLIYFDDGLA